MTVPLDALVSVGSLSDRLAEGESDEVLDDAAVAIDFYVRAFGVTS